MAKITAIPTTTKMRLQPPSDLTPEQARIWQDVVDAKPVDWFSEDTAPLLTEYCRAAAMCQTLAIMVEAAIAGGILPGRCYVQHACHDGRGGNCWW